tara:strand:- start:618 stop:803 length:186 start_codon:yes stop_codon:yes gene_type:complete
MHKNKKGRFMTLQISLEADESAAQALDDQIKALTRSITIKQQAFIHHYLQNRNVTGPYRHA